MRAIAQGGVPAERGGHLAQLRYPCHISHILPLEVCMFYPQEYSEKFGYVLYYDGGMRVDVALPKDDAVVVRGGGTRGKIKGFSRESRKRLLGKIASVDKEEYGNAYLLTLTYHQSEEVAGFEEAKADLRALYKRLVRKFGEGKVTMIWRIELQKRGVPHFHVILILRVRIYDTELVNIVAKNWNEVVGSDVEHYLFHVGALGNGNVPCLSAIKSLKSVIGYVSKYIAKVSEYIELGRIWGILGEKALRYAKKIRIPMRLGELQKLMRLMKRYCRIPNSVKMRVLRVIMINNEIVYRRLEELLT